MPVVVQPVGQAWHGGGRIAKGSWAGSEELEKDVQLHGASLACCHTGGWPRTLQTPVIKGKAQLLPLLLTRGALRTGPGSSCGPKGAL